MTSSLPTIAFFGATGGVANSTLVHALRSQQHCIALVRSSAKLQAQLSTQGLSPETISTYLSIVQGNALSIDSVIQTLTANTNTTEETKPTYLVPNIISSLGAAPAWGWSITKPWQFFTTDQPTLCGDAAHTLVAALKQIYANHPSLLTTQKPRLTFTSTTGISRGAEDVPFGLRFLYHHLLRVPHIDKKVMEETFRSELDEKSSSSEAGCFAGVVGVRPTLLTGGLDVSSGKGWKKLRAGTEMKPETGYLISRADVGEWIWENLVKDPARREKWENEMVSLAS